MKMTETETYEICLNLLDHKNNDRLKSSVSAISDKSSRSIVVMYYSGITGQERDAVVELSRLMVEKHASYLRTQGAKETDFNLAYKFPQDEERIKGKNYNGRSRGLNEKQQNLFETYVNQAYDALVEREALVERLQQ